MTVRVLSRRSPRPCRLSHRSHPRAAGPVSRLGSGLARTVAALTLVGLLGGCSSEDPDEGTNGMGRLPAEAVEERARESAESAHTLRLSGSVLTGDASFRLDMRLGPDGAVGEVSTQGMTFELLRIGEDLYIKADAAFWQYQQSDDAGADGDGDDVTDPDINPSEKLEGKYVKVAPKDPAYEQLSGFTDKSVLLDGLLILEGVRQTGERGEIDGVRTITVIADEGAGGILEVALVGTPYPLRLERGGEAGEVRMADWNKEFTLRAPKDDQIVDYGDQILRSTD